MIEEINRRIENRQIQKVYVLKTDILYVHKTDKKTTERQTTDTVNTVKYDKRHAVHRGDGHIKDRYLKMTED